MVLEKLPPPERQQNQKVGGGFQQRSCTPLSINGTAVESVSTFNYRDVHISKDLTWMLHVQVQKSRAAGERLRSLQ